MPLVVCPRCRAPNDTPPDANGRYRCVICEHQWMAEGALTRTQEPPRAQRPRPPGNPRVSQEYMPDEPASEAVRALTTRQSAEASGANRALPERQARPAPDMKPHSDRTHGGVIPPLKALPSTPHEETAEREAPPRAAPARAPLAQGGKGLPAVTPATPTVEVDMDLFDRLEKEAQVNRSKQKTFAELSFEPAQTPAPGEGRSLACPVCGHTFVATGNAKALTCPQCHTTFDHASGRFATAEPNSAANDPLIGRTLRGCQIDKKIGEGGMGSVYHARQLSLDRSVAIKVLPPDLARNKNFIQRFEREAKSLAKINHPNILHIYDFGDEPALKLYFMIIEFVDGTDLGDVLNRRTTLPQLEVLDLIRQSSMGLEMAAEKGVIHRDIKPDNLMIAETGVCKVSDFGLAKGYGEENEVTSVGVRVGTPAFMSPEQCDGIEVDWRSDVYNLGCTAFLCLTGRLPFDGETPFSIMLKHKNDPIPSVREVSPSVDAGVDRLIQRMLAKRPADRCDSWHALVDELEQLEIRLSADPNILRKTRAQLQALIGRGAPSAADDRVEERRLPSPAPFREQAQPLRDPAGAREPSPQRPAPALKPASPAPAREAAAGAAPAQLPDWLRPVDLPSSPPPGPMATTTPASPITSPSSPPPAAASSRGSGLAPVVRQAEARNASSHDREPPVARPSKRLNTDLEAARERGLRSEADSLAASAERLLAAGRCDEAAREFRKAAEVSPGIEQADRMRARAADALRRGGTRRLGRRVLLLLVVLALLGGLAFLGTPQAHNLLAQREYQAIVTDTRDNLVRADRLRVFARAQKPYEWYVTLFHRSYDIAAANEARAAADEAERAAQGQPTGAQQGDERLRQLEAQFADHGVPLPQVMESAQALTRSSTGREQERAQEILSLAQVQVAKMQPELAGIEEMRKEGRHKEALERAAQFRASYPRAGALAATLPLPARVAVANEDGQPLAEAEVRVDGMPIVGGDRRFCRRGDRDTVLDVVAPGFAPVRQVVPADTHPDERLIEIVLRVAPVWQRPLGKPPEGPQRLRVAPDGVYVQRPDAVALLRGGDGDLLASLDPLPGVQGTSYSTLWVEEKGRILIGCVDGQVRAVDPHTLGVLQVMHRGKAAVLAWMDTDLTYRPGKHALYLIEDARGVRRLMAMQGGQEWWPYQGISGKQKAFLAHPSDRVVTIDDSSVYFLEEDGSSAQIVDLAAERIGAVVALPKEGDLLLPLATGVQWMRFGPRDAPLQPIADPLLAAAGPALPAVDGTTLALARADRGLDLATIDGDALTARWHADLETPAAFAPALAEGVVATVDGKGRVTLRAVGDGAVLGRIAHPAALATAPLIHNGMVVVADVDGNVAAYAIPKK